ncbi:efflux RND transporter periplasmic adaptor subunit, partial [bacterium]|nr:efflux RND transporter periplasmic adaptor subunit [bacterium]
GEITFLSGDIGKKVAEGEEIVKFDNTALLLEIKKADSEKKAALQQIKQTKSAFETTRKEKNRILGLKKKGMVSESEADSIVNQYRTSETNLSRARESAIQIGVRIQLLNESLKDCVVTSPINGIIDSRHYNLKEIYKAGDTIFHVVDIDKIYLIVKIPEVMINKMYIGKKTDIKFEAIPDTVYSGIVQKIPPGQGSDYRSYSIEVLIDNVDHKIRPGMFGKAEFNNQ